MVEPTITYRTGAPVTAGQVADLFRDSGIRRPVDDLPRIEQMLAHGNLTITAWDNDTLVGIARSLTDFCFCCYLSDLAVAKEYQRMGIGRALIQQTQAALTDQVTLLLLAAPEANAYYPHIGFEKQERAWWIPRRT